MAKVQLAVMTGEHVPAAGQLLAARHATERARHPLLPTGPEDPAVGASLVAEMLGFADGVAALDEAGEVVGFLIALERVADPSSPMARYAPERAWVHLVHGHAVADRVDAFGVYAPMYARLASAAVDRGLLDHVAHVPIDWTTEVAWAALGFGRINVVAVRDLAPTGRPAGSGVEVRLAGLDDLDDVDRLVDEEAVFHAGSPIFRPYVRAQTVEAVRAELADQLAGDEHAFLLARHGGRDVGVLSIGPGLGSPLYIPDGGAYIAATAVLPEARGSGVGAALADAAFAWAGDHGYRATCLHYDTSNATSTSFWTGIGFEPAMVHLRRHVTPRSGQDPLRPDLSAYGGPVVREPPT
jgi:GNAT superfamily N-acetyltransferase